MKAAATHACLHCGSPTDGGGDFCCAGCRLVYGILHREGLERYYDLRGPSGTPVAEARAERADRKWLELLGAEVAAGARRVRLDVQGIHCAACVWLLEELHRRAGGDAILVNPALGTMELSVPSGFALTDFVDQVERCGYRLGPPRKQAARGSDGLLRMGICIALAMNAMIFGIATYAGLAEGPVYRMFVVLQLVLAALSVAIGGSVFFRSAWRALRQEILHLDLPIALGIALAFGSSAVAWANRREGAAYFDTLTVFIALMLVGRVLQERVLERNRRLLLADDGTDGLLARRVSAGRVEIVACRDVRAGDELLVAPGDLVCVDAELAEPAATLSLDWVTGESAARDFACGDTLPAGAFNVGARAVRARAAADFAGSSLVPLFRATRARDADAGRATSWWRRLAGIYVVAVLALAAGALVLSLALGRGPGRALDVTAAVLIVTCPCAFGIATPLAYELVQAGLRRAGLFVRTAGFLDRARDVRRVAFDKTGTLTTGTLRLRDDAPLLALSAEERRALYDLSARSAHPKSVAVARAVEACGDARLTEGAEVIEVPGRGVSLVRDGRTYALGAGGDDTVFSVGGRARAHLATVEDLRADAGAETRRLAADGYEVWVVSGDASERVRALAADIGVPTERALGGLTPDGKAAWLEANDRGDTLFVGDGLNDGLVVDRATCSGTPAIDRPFMPARSDFYFVTPGLGPVRLALAAARRLGAVTRRNLAVAVAYNAVTVTLAYIGLMSPLLCAVLMPLSSLTVVSLTVFSLSGRSPLWRS